MADQFIAMNYFSTEFMELTMTRKFSGSPENLRIRLKELGAVIKSSRKIHHGTQLSTECGAKVNLFNTGTLQFQGRDPKRIEQLWDAASNDAEARNAN